MFGALPLPRSLEASFRDVESDRPSTRTSAIRDVVRHAAGSAVIRARAIRVLERALRDDAASTVRSAAAIALADLTARETLPSLLLAMEDEDGLVRQMSIAAIGEIGDSRALARLQRALRDARVEVRYQAVIAFARVGCDDGAAVAGALAHAMDDPDDAVRYIALRLAEEQRPEGDVFRDARLHARAEQLANAPQATIAVAAALYLARLGSSQGLSLVIDVVAGRVLTPELEDEQACVELAGELCLKDTVSHLEQRVWGLRRLVGRALAWGDGEGRSCAWHARIALARMGHDRARTEILADLCSLRRERRQAAVVAAGRARLREARSTLERIRGSVDDNLMDEALAHLSAEPSAG